MQRRGGDGLERDLGQHGRHPTFMDENAVMLAAVYAHIWFIQVFFQHALIVNTEIRSPPHLVQCCQQELPKA